MVAKIKTFLNAHEDIAQLVKFMLFSIIAFIVEYLSFTIIVLCLKNVDEPLIWFVFNYTTEAGGTGAFIGFLVSNILAQIVTFVINRKKTFKANNNVVYSAVMYSIMVCCIIVLNTWMGSALTKAINKSIENLTVCQYIGKLVGSFTAFVISFVMSKYVIMIRKPEPKTGTAAAEAVATTDTTEKAE